MADELVDSARGAADWVCSFVANWTKHTEEVTQLGEVCARVVSLMTTLAPNAPKKVTPSELQLLIIKKLDAELVEVKSTLSSYKQKSTKWRFKPEKHIERCKECTHKLNLQLQMYAENESARSKILDLIEDPDARAFWREKVAGDTGSISVSITFGIFKTVLRRECKLTGDKLDQDAPAVIDIYKFNSATNKGMSTMLDLCKHTNPFAANKRMANEQLHTNVTSDPGRSLSSKSDRPLVKSELSCSFILWCEKGGCLQPQANDAGEANQPGCPLILAPYKKVASDQPESGLQLWRFDQYGCIYNLHSGLVMDVDKEYTAGKQYIIQWTRHAGANQQWKLYLDGTFRAKVYCTGSSVKCLDVDLSTTPPRLFINTMSKAPTQLWRVTNDDFEASTTAIGQWPRTSAPVSATTETKGKT